MGNILKLLARDGDCCALPKQDIFVDFESASPIPEEAELYNEAEAILDESLKILERIEGYKGASKEIREAITNPSPETEKIAWETVIPLVFKLKTFYDFSSQLAEIVPKILMQLCSRHPLSTGSVVEQLDEHQALVKQFAKLLEFVLRFDEAKMTNPTLQNDFSYFRRSSARMRTAPLNINRASVNNGDLLTSYSEVEAAIPINITNAMSLFFANATPMLQAMSESVTRYVRENEANSNITTEMLSMMAKVCQKMLDIPELKSRIQHEETELFILRVMVAIVILYDHVHPTGAFAKGSQVDVKGCIKVLKDQDKDRAEPLLNALRYTTKHLNDENTPKSVKSMMAFEMKA